MTERMAKFQWRLFLSRLIVPAILTIVLFPFAVFFLFIPAIERNSLEHKKEMLHELTTAAWNIVARCELAERQGRLSAREARRLATEQVGNLHYGPQMKDYFWIMDMQPRMILHPYRPDLADRDLAGIADADGKNLFVEMADLVRRQGQGYLQYRWQRPDDPKRISPKLSYVKGFTPWGWVIGTGVYTDDIGENVSSLTRTIIAASLIILGLVMLLVAGSVLQSYRSEVLRRRALKDLEASEERYRTIFETTGTAMSIIGEDLTMVLVNSTFEELSGFSKHDVEGKKALRDFVHRDDYAWMEGYHYARIENPEAAPRTYEFRFIGCGSAEKNMFMTIAVIPHTRLCVASFLDITGYKQALQQRSESEERFRSLVENSLMGIFILQDGRIVYHNPEQERLFGPISSDFDITNFDKVYPEDMPKVRRFYEQVCSGESTILDIDYRFYPRGSGVPAAVRWAYCRACAIDYLGRPALLVNMMDVTRAKELEHMLTIKDKMISLGHVAAGIAHEIRNPLSGINIFLDAIRENFQDPASAADIVSLLAQAQAAAGKIESVVKGVLDFARPGTPRFDLADINTSVHEALQLSHVMLRKSDISVETALGHGLPPVKIDVQQIEQVMLNLITNAAEALQASTGSRRILIKTYADGSDVVVRFCDSGPGIAPEQQARIFEPFYTTKKDGSGIGLSIVRRIVADHRGTITVGRSAEGGAEFTIRIPGGAQT